MAKSLLEKLFNLTGMKLPDLNGNYDPSVYRDESGAGQAGATGHSSDMTGVAKYLAKKQPQNNRQELTGVARYLASRQPAPANHSKHEAVPTGVARYLANKSAQAGTKPATAKSAATTGPARLTGVDKYLAQKKTKVAEQPSPVKVEPLPRKEEPAKTAVVTPEKKPAGAPKAKAPVAQAKAKPEIKAAAAAEAKVIDLTEHATQCQASTLKGTQCRRKTNLEKIDKTVHDKKYKFAVCSQHNNTDFTPFSDYIR